MSHFNFSWLSEKTQKCKNFTQGKRSETNSSKNFDQKLIKRFKLDAVGSGFILSY